MTQNTIAIDPGVSGGIAYVDTDGSVHAMPMPDTLHDVRDQLKILCGVACGTPTVPSVVYVEELPKFAGKMSGSSMATMFRNYGRLEGVLATYRARIVYLRPQAWQKALGLGHKADHGPRWKAHLKGRAQALFPGVNVTLKTADALLILEAGRKLHP